MSTPTLSKMHKRVISSGSDESALKIQGDKAIKPDNKMWEELRGFHSSTIYHLADFGSKVYEQVRMHLSTPELKAKVGNEANLASAINLLAKDITEHRDRLNAIMVRQAGHGNSIATAQEIADMLQIYGEYSDAVEVFNCVVQPTMGIIAQELGVLSTVIQASQAAATAVPTPTA